MCSKSNRHVQMKVAETGMNNLDEEFGVIQEAGSKDDVKYVVRSDE